MEIPLDHRPYERLVPGSKTAVLMVHGIVGSPAHFRHLLPLVPEDWSVCSLLLDGHGGSVSAFAHSSMETWKQQVTNAVDRLLAHHERLLIVAHSMGCLFALAQAIRRPEQICALFLLAVPSRPWPRLSTVFTSLRLLLGPFPPRNRRALDMWMDTSIRLERQPWRYLPWIPRYLELFREVRLTRRELLPRLQTPTHCFQSRRDELVSFRSCRDLETHPHIRLQVLEQSGHFQYGPADIALLQQAFRRQIRLLQIHQEESYGHEEIHHVL